MSEKSVFAHRIRLGRISAAIYRIADPKGEWYSVTIQRHYRDDKGAVKQAHSFGKDDLLVVAEVSRQAFVWVAQQGDMVSDKADSAACQE